MKRRLLSLVFVGVLAFSAGIAFRDQAQDWRDQAETERQAKVVRECPYYVVLTRQGFECKRLMIFYELGAPVPVKR